MLKEKIDSLRKIQIIDLAEQLGLERVNRWKWRGEGLRISIDEIENRYFDHLASTGSYGAIDFTMHVLDYDFKNAIAFLGGNNTVNLPHRSEPAKRNKKVSPPKCNRLDPDKWIAVENYLHFSRGLSLKFLNFMRKKKLIAADVRGNAMFFRHELNENLNRGSAKGATLRSTTSNLKLITTGTKKNESWFFFKTKPNIQSVYLCESPIDACSLAQLNHFKYNDSSLYISTDGCGSIPVEALMAASRGIDIYCAFDNDEAGRQGTARVKKEIPGVKTIYPKIGKDWNEMLLLSKEDKNFAF